VDCATLPMRREQLMQDLSRLCKDLRKEEEFSFLVQVGKRLEDIKALDLSDIVSDPGAYRHLSHTLFVLLFVFCCICKQNRFSTQYQCMVVFHSSPTLLPGRTHC
jgi:hypothetical protein